MDTGEGVLETEKFEKHINNLLNEKELLFQKIQLQNNQLEIWKALERK